MLVEDVKLPRMCCSDSQYDLPSPEHKRKRQMRRIMVLCLLIVLLRRGILVAADDDRGPKRYWVDAVPTRVWQPASVRYVPVFQGWTWQWTESRWLGRPHWAYTLEQVPGHYVDSAVMLGVFSK